jgi:NAD(P)-dependent dehydrogenase (short-subunit alcohol dehydrogenase family)
MSDRLAGKTCVITGTGGAMGRATAELVRAAGGEMVSLQPCRLSDPTECARLVEFATDRFGGIDVLFNLAGRAYFDRLEDISDADWDSARRDEVDLVFYLTRAAWPWLKASHGVVVNMASLNGSLSFKQIPSLSHTANKAAVIGMTRQLALEGSEHGIRVNSTSPGLIESKATEAQLADAEWTSAMVGRTLLGRFGRPEEVANVALFLASNESSYVTGVDLVVDGGMRVW